MLKKTIVILMTNREVILQEEQEEIIKARPSTQKQLSLKEIKQMVYLSQVNILIDQKSYDRIMHNSLTCAQFEKRQNGNLQGKISIYKKVLFTWSIDT